MNLCSSSDQGFYAGFKDAILHDFKTSTIFNIEKIHFRLAFSNEIEKLKNNLQTIANLDSKVLEKLAILTKNPKAVEMFIENFEVLKNM